MLDRKYRWLWWVVAGVELFWPLAFFAAMVLAAHASAAPVVLGPIIRPHQQAQPFPAGVLGGLIEDLDGGLFWNDGTTWQRIEPRPDAGPWVVQTSFAVTTEGAAFVAPVSAAWAAPTTEISCQPVATAADGLTPEAIAVAQLTATPMNQTPGAFDVLLHSPRGLQGTVRVDCTGVQP